MQVLSTEHMSLLSQRSLVYNEAFTRVGMLLTFVSMSLVALALLSGALPVRSDLVVIVAIVLGFDLVVGVATVIRVRNAYQEDFISRAGHESRPPWIRRPRARGCAVPVDRHV